MQIKLFGKRIFEFTKSKAEPYLYNATEQLEKSKFMPDFHTMREYRNESDSNVLWEINTPGTIGGAIIGGSGSVEVKAIKKAEADLKKKFTLTTKKVFQLKFLNKKDFKINTDTKYVDEQLQTFKDKLALIKSSEYDMSRGTNEIASIVLRLGNRKKYADVKDFFEEYAYTTTDRINKVLKNHDNLKLGKVEEFIADMPKEATDAMKDYNKYCEQLCGKKSIFYIIADKKDFKKTEQRRDPILLAQSPFAHVWQILGAWDEEMMFLEEL